MSCIERLLYASSCVCLCAHMTKRPSHWETAAAVASSGKYRGWHTYPLGEAAAGGNFKNKDPDVELVRHLPRVVGAESRVPRDGHYQSLTPAILS